MTTIAMFPGQSSRYPEMLDKLAVEPLCAAVIRDASDLLGRDLRRHFRADNDEMFARNQDVQIGVFLANHCHLRLLEHRGVAPAWSLGLSLGEYNHLVHIGALAFADAVSLVDARGRLYDEASGGLMTSVFPLDAAITEAAIARLELGTSVAIGLYNSPRQHVISGERSAVERLLADLERDEYFDAKTIEPRIPMHAPCFAPTAARLAALLERVPFAAPLRPYIPNVHGEVIAQPLPAYIRTCLAKHVDHPVRWKASVDAIAAHVPAPWFVEVGPRTVLHNLFGKDWMPGRRSKTDSNEAWPAHLTALTTELRDAA